MKRLTALLFILLLTVFATAATPVYAATPTYARANKRNAYFFSEKNSSSSLFAVPYTYCVEVIRKENDEWYYVRYAQDTGIYKGVYGYCRTQDFDLEEGTPNVTYLYKTVTVNYSVEGGNSTLPVLSQIAVEAAYYGTYYAGATVYSYVYCQGSFGYIEGANDDYDLNLPSEQEPTSGDGKVDKTTNSGNLNVGLIIFAVILAASVIIILIINFATKRPRADG